MGISAEDLTPTGRGVRNKFNIGEKAIDKKDKKKLKKQEKKGENV